MNERLPELVSGRILAEHVRKKGDTPVPVEFSGELLFAGGVSASFYCSFRTANQQTGRHVHHHRGRYRRRHRWGWHQLLRHTNLHLTIRSVNHAPTVTTPPNGSVTLGNPYRYDVQASDSDGDPLTYALTGTVPSGMTIDASTGRIIWTPTATGTFSGIKVSATDSFNATTTSPAFSITVSADERGRDAKPATVLNVRIALRHGYQLPGKRRDHA
jgi:putative Ig domain-containing protein